MNIGLLTRGGISNGSARVRALQYIPHLEAAGHLVRVLRRESRSGALRRFSFVAQLLAVARWADVLFLQKPNYAKRLIDLLAVANPRIVVDVDDAVWQSPRAKNSPEAKLVSQRFAERLRYSVRGGGQAVAGSRHIASWLKEQCPEADVTVIPPSVDLEIYNMAKKHVKSTGPAMVGWIGSCGNLGDLDHVRLPLGDLIQKGYLKLRIICDKSPDHGPPCEFVPWEIESEVDALLANDIGIMPLGNDQRSRGRCGYKAIQYMALGIPVVASNVGLDQDVVEHGITGFLASNDSEWCARLEQLSRDHELRAAMGAAARQRVRDRFSVQGNLPRLLQILHAAAGK